MPKLLRPGEKITFVQTRAPSAMWRYLKHVALDNSADTTVTRLCTDHMIEYLSARCWKHSSWLRPQDIERNDGPTGFQQVNLPFSNFDASGKIFTTEAYLKDHGLFYLVDVSHPAYQAAIQTNNANKLIYAVAEKLHVSGATFAYTFMYWLSFTKYPPEENSRLLPADMPAAKPVRARRATELGNSP